MRTGPSMLLKGHVFNFFSACCYGSLKSITEHLCAVSIAQFLFPSTSLKLGSWTSIFVRCPLPATTHTCKHGLAKDWTTYFFANENIGSFSLRSNENNQNCAICCSCCKDFVPLRHREHRHRCSEDEAKDHQYAKCCIGRPFRAHI